MREVTLKVYKFDELSEDVQEQVVENNRDFNVDHEWWDSTYDDFAAICDHMGIELKTRPVKLMGGGIRQKPCIWFSGFYSQGDGACFEGVFRGRSDALEKIKEYAPRDEELHRIASGLQEFHDKYNGNCSVTIDQRGRYSHSHSMGFDFSGWEDSEGNFHELDSGEMETVIELLRDLADWLYRTLEKQYDFLTSDEAVIEGIKANELEFYEDGSQA